VRGERHAQDETADGKEQFDAALGEIGVECKGRGNGASFQRRVDGIRDSIARAVESYACGTQPRGVVIENETVANTWSRNVGEGGQRSRMQLPGSATSFVQGRYTEVIGTHLMGDATISGTWN